MKLLLENWREYLKEAQEFQEVEDYYQIGKSSSEYHPAWDYDPNESPDLLSMEAYELAFPAAQELSQKLRLGSIALYFIDANSVEGHLARYINGTSNSPVIVLTDKITSQDEAVLTLFHELGHAYIDSVGVDIDANTEEEIVEDFAHIVYSRGVDQGLQFLDNAVGESDETPI